MMQPAEARELINEVWRDKAMHGDDGDTLSVRRCQGQLWIDCDECEEGIAVDGADAQPKRFVREFVEDHLACRHTPELTAF